MRFTDTDGSVREIVWVCAYSMSREYGGPEEGGWYYDSGALVEKVAVINSEELVNRTIAEMEIMYPRTGKRSSVNGGADFSIYVYSKSPAKQFPKHIPTYS